MVNGPSEGFALAERPELLALNDTGKEYLGRLEAVEAGTPTAGEPKGSEILRQTDFKVEAFERQGAISPETKRQYEAFLEKHGKGADRLTKGASERSEATAELLRDFSGLRLRDGRSVVGTKVDAGLSEGIESVYRGVSRGIEVAKEELKKQLEFLVSPEEWAKIAEALASAAQNPIDFMDRLITAVKDGGGEVWKQVETMWAASTKTGFSAEMGRYVPEVGIPFLIGSVGPGKFFKILKLDKLLPESLAKKLLGEAEAVAVAGKREVLSVEKLRWLNVRQINYVFEGEIAATKERNLRTIFAEFDRKDRAYPMKIESGRNAEANEWMRFTLGNVDNILDVAVERGNSILKGRVKTEILDPLSRDMENLAGRWLNTNDEVKKKFAAMLRKCDTE